MDVKDGIVGWKHKLLYSSLLVAALYFFIVSIELIKESSLKLSNSYLGRLAALNASPIRALGAGWLSSAVVQSGGAVAATATTFVGTGILSLTSAVFIIFGTRVGATSTALIASLFTHSKLKKGFRHGFEIAVANNIYNLSIVAGLFIFEYVTGIFGKLGSFLGGQLTRVTFLENIPNVIELATGWIVKGLLHAPTIVTILAGFVLLIVMLELFVHAILGLLGGKDSAHKKIDRYFGTAAKAFLAGLVITAIIPSTNVTISLLVPLAAASVIDLRKAIPFIIGANIGTVMDVVIASFVTGEPFSLGTTAVYIVFTLVGAAIWLPNINRLERLTKWICKHILKISPKRAVLYLIVFLLVPFLMLVM